MRQLIYILKQNEQNKTTRPVRYVTLKKKIIIKKKQGCKFAFWDFLHHLLINYLPICRPLFVIWPWYVQQGQLFVQPVSQIRRVRESK